MSISSKSEFVVRVLPFDWFAVDCTRVWTTGCLSAMFVLFKLLNYSWAFRQFGDMNWTTNPALAWPYSGGNNFLYRNVILLLNVPNYLGNGLEKKFIASGVLLDNSRILTSYNPFRKLIGSSNLTDNILALIVTGLLHEVAEYQIANIVCGRQIAYVPDDLNHVWYDRRHSPLHDLMVIRMEEEIGIASSSKITLRIHYSLAGPLGWLMNSLISYPAGPNDQIDTKVRIFSLGYINKENMLDFDIFCNTDYEDEDAVLADCEEWLPRQWGYFICIRNIDNFPGLGSGATLYSKNKLFGIGSFAMFKNDTGVLVFTDVRYYEELIMKTCGDEEFTSSKLTTVPSSIDSSTKV